MIWSDNSSGTSSLWESNSNNKAAGATSQEWLGSIWMIPQTPKCAGPAAVAAVVNEPPSSYQAFKSEMSGFQLLRPHDIGNNMWNNSAAAATMSGIKLPTPAPKAPPPQQPNLKALRINALAYGGPAPPRAPSSKLDMAQNACLQLFSDDFLNYFNTIH